MKCITRVSRFERRPGSTEEMMRDKIQQRLGARDWSATSAFQGAGELARIGRPDQLRLAAAIASLGLLLAAGAGPGVVATGVMQTTAPAAPAVPTANALSTRAHANPLASGDIRLVLVPSDSQASYHAREQLVGRTLPNEAVGTTAAVSGSIVLAADGSVVSDQTAITVDLSGLQSDESRRDNVVKPNTLQTAQPSTATFVPRAVEGLPLPVPSEGTGTFSLRGDLTVHGVTRPMTWQVSAQFSPQGVAGSATTNVNLSDFGMTPPKAGPVLSIEDGLGLELDFQATRG